MTLFLQSDFPTAKSGTTAEPAPPHAKLTEPGNPKGTTSVVVMGKWV